MHDFFRPERLLVERQHDRIGDDVIDEIGAHGSGIAEIAHLDRRGTMGENARAAIEREAFEIDRDVDLELVKQLRRLVIAARTDFVEPVEAGDESRAHVAAVVGPERHSQHFEAGAVVQLEQLRHQKRRRVPMEISRHIGDAQSVVAPRSRLP